MSSITQIIPAAQPFETDVAARVRLLSRRPFVRCLALVVLLTASARLEPLSSSVLDPDIWWHLRGGETIVAQHSFPHQGVFTQHSERPWVEYSWGFEVIASRFYRWFGLMGLVILRSSLEAIITAILFLMLSHGLGSFWEGWSLTAAGLWAIHYCLGTQPMLMSILMFTIELALIFTARRRGTVRPLWSLPPLLLLWANLHIQFIYGILVIGLLAIVSVAQFILRHRWPEEFLSEQTLRPKHVVLVMVACLFATLVGPYSWHLYAVLSGYVHSRTPYAVISELQALSFRSPANFVLVLILVAAYFALGRRRPVDPFNLLLLTVCTLIGFRMSRDGWLICIPALLVIADKREFEEAPPTLQRWHRLGFVAATAVLAAAVFAAICWDSKVTNTTLQRAVRSKFPADACAFVRASELHGPLYNDMNWGGFLIWTLPKIPVAVDNRTDLYGDQIYSRAYLVQSGLSDWRRDPDLNSAQLVILTRFGALASELANDSHFRVAYQDRLAIVLVKVRTNPT